MTGWVMENCSILYSIARIRWKYDLLNFACLPTELSDWSRFLIFCIIDVWTFTSSFIRWQFNVSAVPYEFWLNLVWSCYFLGLFSSRRSSPWLCHKVARYTCRCTFIYSNKNVQPLLRRFSRNSQLLMDIVWKSIPVTWIDQEPWYVRAEIHVGL
jgi:hypothetical protein